MSRISGKVVAITGASSGIGEATALLLGTLGAKLVLGARASDRLTEVGRRIRETGGEAVTVPTDVRVREDLVALVSAACTHFGRLDALVSNAGVAPTSLLDELRVEDWDQMIDVNLRGVLHGIAAALPVFRRQESGHFINIASTAGLITKPTMAVYSATKFAVRALSEGLRQEAGPNLRVTVITPGFVKTNLVDSMTNADVKAQTAEMAEKIAIAPDAIGHAIVFAIEQPPDVDVGEIVIRPTVQV